MMRIALRPVKKGDYNFLWNLHKATMKGYVDLVWGWDEKFQKEYFKRHFEIKNTQIIEVEETSIGSIAVEHRQNAYCITTFEIDPAFQNKGIGSSVLKEIMDTADAKNIPIKLQVLKGNPAKRLYRRFNFEVVSETETHFKMQHSPV